MKHKKIIIVIICFALLLFVLAFIHYFYPNNKEKKSDKDKKGTKLITLVCKSKEEEFTYAIGIDENENGIVKTYDNGNKASGKVQYIYTLKFDSDIYQSGTYEEIVTFDNIDAYNDPDIKSSFDSNSTENENTLTRTKKKDNVTFHDEEYGPENIFDIKTMFENDGFECE